MTKQYYIYIMTNYSQSSLYIGVTSDLIRRVSEHKNHVAKGFTDKYNIDRLVYYEVTDSIESAINREKQLKNWHREWKMNLIRENNPDFNDISADW